MKLGDLNLLFRHVEFPTNFSSSFSSLDFLFCVDSTLHRIRIRFVFPESRSTQLNIVLRALLCTLAFRYIHFEITSIFQRKWRAPQTIETPSTLNSISERGKQKKVKKKWERNGKKDTQTNRNGKQISKYSFKKRQMLFKSIHFSVQLNAERRTNPRPTTRWRKQQQSDRKVMVKRNEMTVAKSFSVISFARIFLLFFIHRTWYSLNSPFL